MSGRPDRLFTEVKGLATRYSRAGEGPPVLLLHGGSIGCSLEVFDEVAELLVEDGFTAVALDMPGYGRTGRPSDLSPAFVRAFVVGFIETVGISPVHLVGHSGNGGTVVRVALEHPELLSSVTVIGTGSLLPETAGAPPREPDEVPDAEPTPEWVRARLLKEVYDPAVLTPERVAVFHEMSVGDRYLAALERRKAPRPVEPGPPLAERLEEISVPVMFVYGDDDKNGAGTRFALFEAAHPGIEAHLIHHSRHFVPLDAPLELERHLAAFAAAHTAP